MHTHPKWKYHATLPNTLVDDKKAEEALGDGWFDTPADAAADAALAEERRAAADNDDTKITEEERLGLIELAKQMGLKPHYKLAADKLLTMIQEERERLAKAATDATE